MPDYPKQDFPWTFYFNGVAMPKWGACWPALPAGSRENWDWEIGPRDFYIVRCKIDNVGNIESANPHSFIYAVQEVLCLLLTERERVLEQYRQLRDAKCPSAEPEEIYEGVMLTACQMREQVREEALAFWTSGYEQDRVRLVEAMRRACLAPNDPEHLSPPHIQSRQKNLKLLWQAQIKMLHQAATTENISNQLRKKLLEL
jgi:hypothetical protein